RSSARRRRRTRLRCRRGWCEGWRWTWGARLEPGRVARREAADRAVRGLPARARLLEPDRVEARAADDHERVARVGVDRHPLSAPRLAPAREAAGVHRRLQ